MFFFSEGNPPVSLFNHVFFFLSDSFRFAGFNPTSPFFFFFFFLSVCLLITLASWFSLIHVWLQLKQKEALLKPLCETRQFIYLAVWYVCVCVCECVLDTVTAGRAAVAGLRSCRAGPCVGGNRTDQLKWDKGGTGFLFNRQPHLAFCHFSHAHTVIARLYNSILDAQCMTVYDSSKQWLHRQPCISDEVMKLSGPDMMCETKVLPPQLLVSFIKTCTLMHSC